MKNNHIPVIIAREYLTRVRKKSFIILTILMPILMAALIVVPVLLVLHSEKKQHTSVLVVDDTEIFLNAFKDTENTTYTYQSGDVNFLKKDAFDNEKYDCVFHILDNSQGLKSNLYYRENLPSQLQGNLESQMNEIFFDKMLQDSFHIDLAKFEQLQELTKVEVATIQVDDEGTERENDAELNEVIGMLSGLMIYFFIIIFASQVLRGVLEEKSNRIVEVLISSVKPLELLVGKIVGIALVGITQFLVWVLLTCNILLVVQLVAPELTGADVTETTQEMMTATTSADAAGTLNIFEEISNYFPFSFTQMLLCFFFFFIVGYLIYSTLYAAMGSVVDSESDSQQFTLPVTIPLILAIALVPSISADPSSTLAVWFSMIPLTSPVAMMVRLPSGVPLMQLLASMALAVLFLFLCVWFAAKVYRVGILMYGKKPTWKEIFRWLRKA